MWHSLDVCVCMWRTTYLRVRVFPSWPLPFHIILFWSPAPYIHLWFTLVSVTENHIHYPVTSCALWWYSMIPESTLSFIPHAKSAFLLYIHTFFFPLLSTSILSVCICFSSFCDGCAGANMKDIKLWCMLLKHCIRSETCVCGDVCFEGQPRIQIACIVFVSFSFFQLNYGNVRVEKWHRVFMFILSTRVSSVEGIVEYESNIHLWFSKVVRWWWVWTIMS